MELGIKALSGYAVLPTRGTADSAGMDLYAAIQDTLTITPHETKMIPTGLAMEIPDGYFGAIYPRSGLSTKRGLRLANCVAVIDSDYRGEVGVPLHNDSNDYQDIYPRDRIAQLVIQPYLNVVPTYVASFDKENTERGTGGFGHTGT